ncbi:2,3-bisphosphoglycerate-independent phosphoglycerate mutase [Flavobacteriales bacterium]|nr:2,3-bisphosphoglycerate-independent phosphoglycerate mutase [Flavobacteriales bacterium]MDC1063822.1 2,3-bisphosphoglycerate-independent phosphoglycerate mutase [Flavobacteriales bacterium]
MQISKTILIILDGWGHGNKSKSDVIYNANTPFIDSLYTRFPNSELLTDGEKVGLPNGQMGNSEVGHLNIGAGRIVNQDLVKINNACETNLLAKNKNLLASFEYVKKQNSSLHLIGLVSNGGIHSHQKHLYSLCRLANENKIAKVYIHAFTDGRDCDPKSAKNFIKELEKNLFGAKIASISGRFYAMDRDKRWERIKKSYEAMVNGSGLKTSNIQETIQDYYNENITDEFIPPTVCVDSEGSAISLIQDGDAVICFNFRTDRCREITTVLTQKNMPKFQMNTLNLHYTTMTRYDQEYIDVNVLFDKKNIENTLGEVLARHKLSQTRIAETEKYPHVTYFFSGGREVNFEGEKRLMVDSPKVSTYDIQPEMSAYDLTNITIDEINKLPDFICVNFANPDMVGHTGNYKAILKAIEVVDVCTQKVVEAAMDQNYKIMIIADHGNADFAINADGSPNTAHSLNPVPCFIINTTFKKMNNGILADVAPTILRLIGVEKPEEMTGKSLI